jgi:hypothetical protein
VGDNPNERAVDGIDGRTRLRRCCDRPIAIDGLLLVSTSAASTFTISCTTVVEAARANPRFTYTAMTAMGTALESGAVDGVITTAPI